MGVPFPNGSVLEAGRNSIAEPFLLKVICFLATCDFQDDEFPVSHVNSPDRRNLANAMQIAVLMLRSSNSLSRSLGII